MLFVFFVDDGWPSYCGFIFTFENGDLANVCISMLQKKSSTAIFRFFRLDSMHLFLLCCLHAISYGQLSTKLPRRTISRKEELSLISVINCWNAKLFSKCISKVVSAVISFHVRY